MASPAPVRGHESTSDPLHEERLDAVIDVLRAARAGTVLDLGCGSGALLRRLVRERQLSRIVGVDTSLMALLLAERLLASEWRPHDDRVSLQHGSLTEADLRLAGFDAAVLLETIEHIPPAHISRLEVSVFARLRPAVVVITTPNREYNIRYGKTEGELRHLDHQFEWTRSKFRSWAAGVGVRNGYGVTFQDIGANDPWLGSPTQMGVFRCEPT